MTNINCSKKCIYQQDGKCGYDCVLPQKIPFSGFSDSDCAYYVTKTPTQNESAASDKKA